MLKKEYTFEVQKQVGEKGENAIEEYLLKHKGVSVEKVYELSHQLKGIDFQVRLNERPPLDIEVKVDNICHRNGRYFLEVELVKANGRHSKDGWVLSTQSNFLFLLVGNTNSLKVVKPQYLRDNLYRWQRAYGYRECYNKGGYSSIGICVPYAMIKGLSLDITETCDSMLDYMYSN